jgi:hypothetical protein
VDHALIDRRIDIRFAVSSVTVSRATLRPGCAVRVVDLSAGGALVQAAQPLRPGARVHLQLVTTTRVFGLVAAVLRCAVWTLHAELGATYCGALQFEERWDAVWEVSTLDGSQMPGFTRPSASPDGHELPRIIEARWEAGRGH